MSGSIILIGGGSFEKKETLAIDKKAIELTQKEIPKVLIIPAAMHDDQGYGKRLKQYFRSLGCQATTLRLWHTKLVHQDIHQQFLNADLIYLGAGSTQSLLEILYHWELAPILKQAYQNGCVIVGISAGANVLCEQGYSDNIPSQCVFIKGIGLVPCVFTPHGNHQNRIQFEEEAKHYSFPILKANDLEAYIYHNGEIQPFSFKESL